MPERPGHILVTGGAEMLARALPVEPGAVRSRRILSTPDVIVVALTLGEGAIMKEHLSTSPLLLQVIEGHAVLEIRRERVDMPAGALVQVDAQVRHSVEGLEPSRLLLILLSPHARALA